MSRLKFSRATPGDLDHEIMELLFALISSFHDTFVAAVEASDLTAPQGHLLLSLDEPVSMSELAKEMGFDASHITSIVDRLEERGFVERRPDPHDRRIKRIVITPDGQATRERVEDVILQSVALDALNGDQRTELRDLLAIATAGQGVERV